MLDSYIITSENKVQVVPVTEPALQRLPEELLILILQYVSFRGLRNLLYCPSRRLAKLAHQRLCDWQACLRARPGAAEELKPVRRVWDERPWPDIEEVGRRLLGKELVLVDTFMKDDFSFAIEDLPPRFDIRPPGTTSQFGLSQTSIASPLGLKYHPARLVVFLSGGVCCKVRWGG